MNNPLNEHHRTNAQNDVNLWNKAGMREGLQEVLSRWKDPNTFDFFNRPVNRPVYPPVSNMECYFRRMSECLYRMEKKITSRTCPRYSHTVTKKGKIYVDADPNTYFLVHMWLKKSAKPDINKKRVGFYSQGVYTYSTDVYKLKWNGKMDIVLPTLFTPFWNYHQEKDKYGQFLWRSLIYELETEYYWDDEKIFLMFKYYTNKQIGNRWIVK